VTVDEALHAVGTSLDDSELAEPAEVLAAEVDRLRNHLVMQDDAIAEANSLRFLLDSERLINSTLAATLDSAKQVIEHRDAEIQRLEARIAQLTSDAP
jgi:cell division protein FtsB